MRGRATERGVLEAIRYARFVVPEYASGRPVTRDAIDRLARFHNLDVFRLDIETPAMLTAPCGSPPRYRLGIRADLPRPVVDFITLHEIRHVVRQDVQEPTILMFTGEYPEWEYDCDLFALMGLMDPLELGQGERYVERRIRELVPLDNYGWQTYRIPALAPRAVRMRSLIEDGL